MHFSFAHAARCRGDFILLDYFGDKATKDKDTFQVDLRTCRMLVSATLWSHFSNYSRLVELSGRFDGLVAGGGGGEIRIVTYNKRLSFWRNVKQFIREHKTRSVNLVGCQ
jgi:hypothetical protein